jgi:hypothetical protein
LADRREGKISVNEHAEHAFCDFVFEVNAAWLKLKERLATAAAASRDKL